MLPNGVMNAEDVARYLHLGKNTVYQLAKSGQIASYHVGRKLRFTIEDVEAYVASTHRAAAGGAPGLGAGAATGAEAGKPASGNQDGAQASRPETQELVRAASFGVLKGNPFIIAGGDPVADLLASSLNADGHPAARLVRGSYAALVNLYAGEADAAVVHLFDQRSNSYNIPYVRNLAPGESVAIVRLYARKQGLIVQKGNPKKLTSWGSLLREGVRISNRVKGSGSRVLLDEKLRAMEARVEGIEGYDTHAAVASVAIERVASGLADVAVGSEREALRQMGVDFVPLQTEWVDLVVLKSMRTRPTMKRLMRLFESDSFARDAQALAPCDLSKLGSVVYES